MRPLFILVEGATERGVVESVFARDLAEKRVYLYAKDMKGNRFERFINEVEKFAKDSRDPLITMMFDYYGMKGKWPGTAQPSGSTPHEIALSVERMISQEVEKRLGSNIANRFIPYVQMHELETLLYADPEITSELLQQPEKAEIMKREISEAGECEKINNSKETCPAKRISGHFSNYKKGDLKSSKRIGESRLQAMSILGKIGIPQLKKTCPHFAYWYNHLETLGD